MSVDILTYKVNRNGRKMELRGTLNPLFNSFEITLSNFTTRFLAVNQKRS